MTTYGSDTARVPTYLKLPADVRAWLVQHREGTHATSVTGQVVRLVREEMARMEEMKKEEAR